MPEFLSIDQLSERRRQLAEDVWAGCHKEWDEDALYYDGLYKIDVPEWIDIDRKVVPTTPRQTIDHSVDQIVTSEPLVRRPKVGDDKNAEELAATLGEWGTHLLRTFNRDALLSPGKTFAKHLFLYGYAAAYGPTWDDSVWPLRPDRRRKDFSAAMDKRSNNIKRLFPFRLQVPHPSKILLDPTELKQPSFGFLQTKRFIKNVREEFGKSDEQVPGREFDEIDVYTYFDENQHTVWSERLPDQTLLTEKKNPYGFVPFRQTFLGLGRDVSFTESVDGRKGDALASLAVGFLRFLRSQIRAKSLSATAVNHMLWRYAFQHIITSLTDEEFSTKYGQGLVISGVDSPSSAVVYEQVPNVPAWVFEFERSLDGDIEAGTFSNILRGNRPVGVDTASQHAQITAKAKQVFNNPIQQINHIASLWVGDCARLVTVFKDPVTMRGMIGKHRPEITIDGDDFQDNFNFEVDIEANDPMEQAFVLEGLFALKAAGQLDTDTFVDEMPVGILNISNQELKARLKKATAIEQLLLDPDIIGMQKAEVQRRWAAKMNGGGGLG
jgi:hypothetical protein